LVVGDLIGAGEAQERGVVGETPNLAAGLQALTEPNTVAIGPRTRGLLGNLFEYHDLGRIKIKGLVDPVRAYRVVRLSAIDSPLDSSPSKRIWVRSVATWETLPDDELERLDESA
jgi:class 3 adenylate cyclase